MGRPSNRPLVRKTGGHVKDSQGRMYRRGGLFVASGGDGRDTTPPPLLAPSPTSLCHGVEEKSAIRGLVGSSDFSNFLRIVEFFRKKRLKNQIILYYGRYIYLYPEKNLRLALRLGVVVIMMGNC